MLFKEWDDEKWKVLVRKGFNGSKSYHLKGPSTTFVFNEYDFLQLYRNIRGVAENIHEKEPYFIQDGTIINREIGTQLISIVDDCDELNRLYKENKVFRKQLGNMSMNYQGITSSAVFEEVLHELKSLNGLCIDEVKLDYSELIEKLGKSIDTAINSSG